MSEGWAVLKVGPWGSSAPSSGARWNANPSVPQFETCLELVNLWIFSSAKDREQINHNSNMAIRIAQTRVLTGRHLRVLINAAEAVST